MSFAATLLFKNAGSQIIAVWLQTTVLNFPMAFFLQLCFAGPIVRFVFGKIFNENRAQSLFFYFTKEKTFAKIKEDEWD